MTLDKDKSDVRIKKIDNAAELFIKGIKSFNDALQDCDDVLMHFEGDALHTQQRKREKEKHAHVYVHKGAIYYRMYLMSGNPDLLEKSKNMYEKAYKLDPTDRDIRPIIGNAVEMTNEEMKSHDSRSSAI